jgi:hypothetical protein
VSCLVVEEKAINLPSKLKEILEGAELSCLYILSGVPVPLSKFQSFTYPSAPPVATMFPIGLMAMQEPYP